MVCLRSGDVRIKNTNTITTWVERGSKRCGRRDEKVPALSDTMTRPPLTTRIKEEYSRGTVPNGILVLTVGVIAVLLALQFLISTDIIPWDLATRYFFLNVQSPNLASVFLTHYVHTPFFPVRLVATALVFALTMCCIYLFGYLSSYPRRVCIEF